MYSQIQSKDLFESSDEDNKSNIKIAGYKESKSVKLKSYSKIILFLFFIVILLYANYINIHPY